MTSTLISDIDTRLRAKARAAFRRNTVAAGIDLGTRNTKTAIIGTHGDHHIVYNLIDEPAGPSEDTVRIVSERADLFACRLGGPEVRTYLMEFPPVPLKELDILVSRKIAQNRQGDLAVSFKTRPGVQGKVEVMAVAASRQEVTLAFDELARRGIPAKAAYADVEALAECVKHSYPQATGRALCIFNMGAAWSELVLLHRGNIVFSRSIKIGLDNLIDSTAQLCGLTRDEAMQTVFEIGANVMVQDADTDDLMGRTYAESVREVIEQLVVEAQRSLSFATMRHNLAAPEVILLCGGAAMVPGMDIVLNRETGTPVEVFDPLQYMPKGDDVDSSANGSLFCVAIGLGLLALSPESPGLTPAAGPRGPALANRLTTAIAMAAVALALIFAGGRALESSGDRYEEAIEMERHVLESVNTWLAADGGEIAPVLQTRDYIFSLIDEPAPLWRDVMMELSRSIPPGIILDQVSFSKSGEVPGDHPQWSISATGLVVNMEQTVELLRQIQDTLERSGLFSQVEVLPQGSTSFTYRGKKLDGVIRFELGAVLE